MITKVEGQIVGIDSWAKHKMIMVMCNLGDQKHPDWHREELILTRSMWEASGLQLGDRVFITVVKYKK